MFKYTSKIFSVFSVIAFIGFCSVTMAQPNPPQPGPQKEKAASKSFPCLEDYRNLIQRPKRIFIGVGTRIPQLSLSAYEKHWADQVESAIELHRTSDLKVPHGMAELKVTIQILPLGQVGSIEIDKSSGFRRLDTGIMTIVRDSAPFAPFPQDLCMMIDTIYFTATFQFTRNGPHLIRD